MQHILGVMLRNNDVEILDDHAPGTERYSLMGLHAAIAEGNRRMKLNPDIVKINIYEVFDGVRRASPHQGQYGLVYALVAQELPNKQSKRE